MAAPVRCTPRRCRRIVASGACWNWSRIMERYAAMQDSGRVWLESERIAADRRRFERVIEARYKGQNHEVQVRLADDDARFGDFAGAFADAHRREYGYDIPARA